jgi:uncharacterized protein YuzE
METEPKPIRFSRHPRMPMEPRGATDAAVIETLRLSAWQPPRRGKAETRKLSDDVVASFGPDGRLAGLEIRDASRVLDQADGRVVVEIEPPAPARPRAPSREAGEIPA